MSWPSRCRRRRISGSNWLTKMTGWKNKYSSWGSCRIRSLDSWNKRRSCWTKRRRMCRNGSVNWNKNTLRWRIAIGRRARSWVYRPLSFSGRFATNTIISCSRRNCTVPSITAALMRSTTRWTVLSKSRKDCSKYSEVKNPHRWPQSKTVCLRVNFSRSSRVRIEVSRAKAGTR